MGASLCAADVGPSLPSFKLYVERANNLKKADLLGHSDPYVVAQFLDMRPGLKQSRRVEKKYPELKRFRQRTRVIQNEPDPVWKEIFVMNEVPSEFVLLRLEVFDKDKIGRDTFLGRVDTQLGYWDRKARRWRSRFDNVDIPEGERLFFPVVRKEAVLRTRMKANGTQSSAVTGTLTFRLTRERGLDGRLMN